MTEWQPIETAPKDGTALLGKDVAGDWPFVMKWEGEPRAPNGGYWAYCEALLSDVAGEATPTHWMPLPDPPKEQPK